MSQIKKLQLGGTTLKFGSDRVVDADPFYDRIASDVEDYIASQDWSRAEKERFREAYKDIMSRGVTGMLVVDGVRNTTYNGSLIDLSMLSTKYKKAYEEAAYYINKKLEESSYNPEQRAKEEQEKIEEKEKLRLNSLPKFTNSFADFFIEKVFGGNFRESGIMDWHELDRVDPETLYRETKNRRIALSKIIDDYINQLPEYNYEGSPYSSLEDYKLKLLEARNSLINGDSLQDVKMALNRAGINWRDYLETETIDDPKLRLQFEYNKRLLEEELRRQEEEKKKLEESQNSQNQGQLKIEIDDSELIEINKLEEESIKELWDKNPEKVEYMLGAITADLFSLIDPEPFSAAALGLGAAALRGLADPDRSLGDSILDYGIGALGAFPLFGDALVGARMLKSVSLFLNIAGGVVSTILAGMGAPHLLDKVKLAIQKGDWKELSFSDLTTLYNAFSAARAFKNYKRTNTIGKQVAEGRGLRYVGNIKLKYKDPNTGLIKTAKIDIDDTFDSDIWKNLKSKPVAEQIEIIKNNKSLAEGLKKLGINVEDLIIKRAPFYSTRRYSPTNSDVKINRRYYTVSRGDWTREAARNVGGGIGAHVVGKTSLIRTKPAPAPEPAPKPKPKRTAKPKEKPKSIDELFKTKQGGLKVQAGRKDNAKKYIITKLDDNKYEVKKIGDDTLHKVFEENDEIDKLFNALISGSKRPDNLENIFRSAGIFKKLGGTLQTLDNYLNNFIINHN